MGIFKEISDWWNDLFKDDVTKEQEQKMITELAGMEAKERERLENIVKEYAASNRPQDLEFEYLEEYVPIDNETLMDKSEKQYSEIYNAEKDLANEKYQEKLNKVEETEKGYIDNAEIKNNNYKEKYKDKTESFKSTASKNGIADSSIMGAKSEDLNNERDRYIDDVMKALQSKLNSTANKKEDILNEKNLKIQNLDSNFTKNVEDLFNKYLKEEENKVKEVEKANKDTANKEKAYKEYQDRIVKEKAKEMENLQKEMKEKEERGIYEDPTREAEYDKRLEIARDFYKGFTKKSAIKAIQENSTLQKFLGLNYYRLLEEIQNG